MNEPNAETAMTGFWAAIKTCFVKYARFKRRASRAEFWWFFLFTLLIIIVTRLLDPQGALQSLWMLAVLLPSLAVGARRLHDIGRSGWWQLLYLTIYGAPLLLILFCLKPKTDEVIAAQNGMLTRIENRVGAVVMSFWTAIKTCFVKYARFKGRASRAEFWWFFLFTLLISMATLLLNPQGALQSLWMLAVLLPSLAVGARRLHDIGHNSWWQLLYLTVYGAPLLLILFCLKTKADEVVAAQNGMLTRIENRIGAWRAKIWAWAKLHPFRFVATTLVILFVLYAVCFLIFHIVADCPSDLENWETWLNWGLGIGALIAVVGLGGGAPLLGVGSIGWVGKTYFIGFSGSVGATAYNVFQPVSENTHVLFCF